MTPKESESYNDEKNNPSVSHGLALRSISFNNVNTTFTIKIQWTILGAQSNAEGGCEKKEVIYFVQHHITGHGDVLNDLASPHKRPLSNLLYHLSKQWGSDWKCKVQEKNTTQYRTVFTVINRWKEMCKRNSKTTNYEI